MHYVIERARKAAGISGMRKNYPDDPKQRGCGFWAAVLGVISDELSKRDQDATETAVKHKEEMSAKHLRIEELEADLRRVKDASISKGVELVRHQEGWTLERGREALKTIAG